MSIGTQLRSLRQSAAQPGPNRFAPGYLRSAEPAQVKERTRGEPRVEGGAAMSTPEEVVVYAVRLGYKVAEEQLRKGRNAARRLRQASVDTGSGDVGEVLAQGLRIYRQVGELLVEVAETLGASTRIWGHLYSKFRDQSKSAQSTSEQDLKASLSKLSDAVAGKVSETIDHADKDGRMSSAFGALLKQMSPAAAAMLAGSGAGSSNSEQSAAAPAAAFVDPPPGFVGVGVLEMVRAAPRGKRLVSSGLVMGERALRAEVTITRKGGAWEATVDAREADDAGEGSYRGAVHVDGHNVGFLMVTLRKRAPPPATRTRSLVTRKPGRRK